MNTKENEYYINNLLKSDVQVYTDGSLADYQGSVIASFGVYIHDRKKNETIDKYYERVFETDDEPEHVELKGLLSALRWIEVNLNKRCDIVTDSPLGYRLLLNKKEPSNSIEKRFLQEAFAYGKDKHNYVLVTEDMIYKTKFQPLHQEAHKLSRFALYQDEMIRERFFQDEQLKSSCITSDLQQKIEQLEREMEQLKATQERFEQMEIRNVNELLVLPSDYNTPVLQEELPIEFLEPLMETTKQTLVTSENVVVNEEREQSNEEETYTWDSSKVQILPLNESTKTVRNKIRMVNKQGHDNSIGIVGISRVKKDSFEVKYTLSTLNRIETIELKVNPEFSYNEYYWLNEDDKERMIFSLLYSLSTFADLLNRKDIYIVRQIPYVSPMDWENTINKLLRVNEANDIPHDEWRNTFIAQRLLKYLSTKEQKIHIQQ